MREPSALLLVGAVAFLLGLPLEVARCEMLELRPAVVLTPKQMSPREKKATEMLLDEVEARTQIRWPVVQTWPDGKTPVVVVGETAAVKALAQQRSASLPSGNDQAEGYRLWTDHGGAWVAGNDERGVLFGVGRLLREMRMSRQRIELADDLKIGTSPQMKIRGHQLGYRPKCNSYDGWTVAIWEQYIRDLAVFGCNTIELIPPRSDDNPDSPLFPLPQMRMMTEMSRLADEYGLDVSIWYPAMDEDYSRPATVDFALKEWGDVFAKLPRVDALFVPGGDPGHTRPKYLLALLEKQAANLHRYHPNAKIWVSPQSFDRQWMDEFFELLAQEPKWLDGIVYGPQIRIPLAECRRRTPARYPIRNYPDITHTQHCQYPVPDWDLAYAVTEGREPVCPRPTQMANIFRVTRPYTAGFVTYSEGCNDDVNKVIFSALGWDPDADVTQILREYARYFVGAEMQEDFAQGILSLERNWRGPLISNDAIDTTLSQFNAMEKAAFPRAKLAWRFQQAIYRANYDAYVHKRSQYETELEKRAIDELSQAQKIGSLATMHEAEQTLEKAVTEPVAQDVRARVFEMAEALFQSIRMQLSVPRYDAESVGRGANLDRVDAPLNNRRWLERQFEEIRKLESESQRLARINEIVHWTDPGPGGFYDDLGNMQRQPHLVVGMGWEKDPDFYHTANIRVEDARDGNSPSPMSWWSTAGSLYDEPLRMHYDNLDPGGHYTLRVVYPPSGQRTMVKLVANDKYEIHPAMRKESQRLEFAIPPEATASGHLDLAWTPEQGLGHNGRNVQVAEVWLIHN